MKKTLLFCALACAVASHVPAFGQTLPEFDATIMPVPGQAMNSLDVIPAPEYKFGKFRLALDVAGNIRVGKTFDEKTLDGLTSEETLEFLGKMRFGVSYGASVTGFFNTRFGLGAKFVGTHYASSGYGYVSKANVFYVGPEFVVRLPVGSRRNAWIFSASMGYARFHQKMTHGGMEGYLHKGGIKSTLEAGFDIRIGKNVFLGPKLVISVGSIPFEMDGETYLESLNAIEIGGGIRF